MKFNHDDGGRSKYFNGNAGDCVVRAIAIASGMDYKEVYDELFNMNKEFASTSRKKIVKKIKGTPRDGNFKDVYGKLIEKLGFKWIPTMKIGSGCTVHLREGELPSKGVLIVKVSRHLTTVIDGVIHDTHDPSRDGTRCVYGYWIKGAK